MLAYSAKRLSANGCNSAPCLILFMHYIYQTLPWEETHLFSNTICIETLIIKKKKKENFSLPHSRS
ncbi:Uncharacterized protein TCM_035566 [Theobroma cacao]|uniref:Uncharacterized protein n=1 Tax=Theobroma cacao TaxID=3641 RepID=A0A061FQD3_THECC|nr:Uncharacterized protein TCM_035566 [Theobroma cacao]